MWKKRMKNKMPSGEKQSLRNGIKQHQLQRFMLRKTFQALLYIPLAHPLPVSVVLHAIPSRRGPPPRPIIP